MATAKFIGVYARNPGPAKAAPARKSNWFVWEDDWGRYRIQLLDGAFQPLDNPRSISSQEFKQYFTAQPQILVTPIKQLELGTPEEEAAKQAAEIEKARQVKQDIAELSTKLGIEVKEETGLPATLGKGPVSGALGSIGKAGAHNAASAPEAAPKAKPDAPLPLSAYEQAAQLDTETRTDFALALTRWRRGDKDRSMMAFKSILKLQHDIMPPHKHMFTDFAIDLRKCALTTLAKEFYRRAVALAPDDSNALFNLARIYFETGEIHSAVETLDKALELEPDFDYALRFRKFLCDNYPKQVRTSQKQGPKAAAQSLPDIEKDQQPAEQSSRNLVRGDKFRLSMKK